MSNDPTTPPSSGPESGSNPNIPAEAAELRDKVVNTAQRLGEAAVEKAESLKSAAADKAGELRDAAQRRAEEFRSTAEEQWDTSCEKAKELQVKAEDYIRANPMPAVLGALGIGFLLGLTARR